MSEGQNLNLEIAPEEISKNQQFTREKLVAEKTLEKKTPSQEASPFIEKLLEHKNESGPLTLFIDWNYIKEQSNDGVFVKIAQKGEEIVNRENADQFFYVILDGEVKYEKREKDGNVVKSAINKPYEYFGEKAILNQKINDFATNTVESNKTTLLAIKKDVFLKAIDQGKEHLFETLKKENINLELDFDHFEGIPQELVKEGYLNTYRKEHSITTQTQEQKSVVILLSGEAFVLRESRRIKEISPGGIIGDIEVFKPDRVNIASVITKKDSVVLEIEMDKFEKIINNYKALKTKFSENAKKKEIDGRKKELVLDPNEDYQYNFSRIDQVKENQKTNDEEEKAKEERKAKVLEVARETVSIIFNSKDRPVHNNEAEASLDKIFSFICKSLEDQELDNPEYFVSHGITHTLDTLQFAESIFEGSATLRGDIERVFGQENGKILLRMVALFHDIGYPELNKDKSFSLPKFKHQEFSAKFVEENLPYDLISKVINLNQKQYDLFLQAIKYHGSDSLNIKQINEGRTFLWASNKSLNDREPYSEEQYNLFLESMKGIKENDLMTVEIKEKTKQKAPYSENPALVIMRLADNLDLISDRLDKLQKDPDFMEVMKSFHDRWLEIKNEAKNNPNHMGINIENKITEEMEAIFESATNGFDQKLNEFLNNSEKSESQKEDEKRRIEDIRNNLADVVGIKNWNGYTHFMSVAIGQNIFVREKDDKLEIFVEYNKPASELTSELINHQAGRLEAATESLIIKNSQGDNMKVKINEIFP
jgi:CRP-like cAMP-binding protein